MRSVLRSSVFVILCSAVHVSACFASAPGDDQYAVAASHYAAGRWELAIGEFTTLIQQFPDHPKAGEASFFVGEALVQLGRYADAEPHFEKFSRQHPDHSLAGQALFRRGEIAYFREDLARCQPLLEQFLQTNSEDKMAAYAFPYLAATYLGQARENEDPARLAKQAETSYDQALKQFPEGPLADQCRFGRARALDLQKNTDAAAAYRELLNATEPSIATQAHFFLANLRFQANDYAEAARLFAHVITAEADGAWANASRGPLAICYAREGRWEDAQAVFQASKLADARSNQNDLIVAHLAEHAFAAEQWDWADILFTRLSTSAAPTYRARGLSGSAWIAHRTGKPADAAASFEQLVRTYPQDALAAEAAFMRAAILDELQQHEQALVAYQQVTAQYPDSPDYPTALFRAGLLHEQAGQGGQAAEAYQKLIQLEGKPWPQTDVALYRLAWVLHDLERADAATISFKAIHADHRDSKYWPDATYRLALRAFEKGDRDDAGRLLAELIGASPPAELLVHAHYLQARIAQASGQWAAMETQLTNLLDQATDEAMRSTAEYWMAEAAYQQGNHAEAAERFRSLSNRLPQLRAGLQPMVLMRQAQLAALEKNWDTSLEIARAVAEKYPNFTQQAELQYLIGQSLIAKAQFDAARVAFQKAAPRDGSRKTETAAMSQWMIGESYLHQENYDAALREYLRVEALYAYPQWQAAALLQAGKCYEKLSQPDEATRLYRQILQQYGDSEFAEEATQRLDQPTSPTSG